MMSYDKIDKTINDTKRNSITSKSESQIAANEAEAPLKSSEKKKKAPKIADTLNTTENGHNDETKSHKDDTSEITVHEYEEPIKPKKKRAPKAETNDENNPSMTTEEQPVKKKKSKAPKPIPNDDEFQPIDTPAIDDFEVKPKEKKRKKAKATAQKMSDSFDDLQVTNLDEGYPTDAGNKEDTTYGAYDSSFDALPPEYSAENGTSDYEKAIMDTYTNLASKVDFSLYVGEDDWSKYHPPKAARTEPKSRIRKMLPGSSDKDEKLGIKTKSKTAAQKGSLMTRLLSGASLVNILVRDEKNLLFGEQSQFDVNDDDPDGVDTDDLHRYAQRLRELEDNDREVNPEFLVLQDGKTVYGVHEADSDGKVKLATRKPIYDRFGDQKPDEQAGKKTILSRLKVPFTRNKDKDSKSSPEVTPKAAIKRKSSKKSLNEDVQTIGADDPMIY